MSYRELLSQMIESSGLSLREISRRCIDKGQKIDASYLSKLQTGKLITSSEDINRTIAEVCGGNADQLVWHGYMDKAPSIIRDYVNTTLPSLKDMLKMLIPSMVQPEQVDMLTTHIDNLSPIELVKLVNEMMLAQDLDIGNDFHVSFSNNHSIEIDDYNVITLPMLDDSMESIIPMGANMKVVPIQGIPENGTVVVYKKDDCVYVRRWYSKGDEIILIPSHEDYDPIMDEINHLTIIGQVKSYTLNL